MSKKNRPDNRLVGPALSGYLTFPVLNFIWFTIIQWLIPVITSFRIREPAVPFWRKNGEKELLVPVISKPSKKWQPFLKEPDGHSWKNRWSYCSYLFMFHGSRITMWALQHEHVHDLPNGFYVFIITTDPIVYELPSILPFHPKLSKSTHLRGSTHFNFTFKSQLVLQWPFPTS